MRISYGKFAAVLSIAVALVACGHTESYVALLREAAPSDRTIEVYVDSTPTRPFTDAAILQAIGYGGRANPEELVKVLLAEGAHVGCDAIVRVQFDYGASSVHATGNCVRYTGPAPSPRVAPSAAPAPSPASSPNLSVDGGDTGDAGVEAGPQSM